MTATSKDGLTGETSIAYSVSASPSVSIKNTRALVAGGRAKITVACRRSACRGTLSLTLRERTVRTVHHPRKVSLKTVVLAHAAYTAAAGQSRSIRLQLTGAALRLLADAPHRRLAVTASATVTGGSAAHQTITLASGSPAKG